MVQLLLLYYLSIKSTHGYEIQQFIQVNHMDEWNSIKSGSIYYAMSKLEKKGYIELVEKYGQGEKSRKRYRITTLGLEHLKYLAEMELAKPLTGIKSEKFLLYPIIANLSKTEIISHVRKHIEDLDKQLNDIDYWQKKKISQASAIEKMTFKLMKDSMENQILWHKTIIDSIDEIIEQTAQITRIIKSGELL